MNYVTILAQLSPGPARLPQTVTREQLQYMADVSAVQVFAALVLTVAMLLAIGATAAVAFGWRKTALGMLAAFGTAVMFIPSGYCFYYGGAVLVLAGIGFLRPKRREAIPLM